MSTYEGVNVKPAGVGTEKNKLEILLVAVNDKDSHCCQWCHASSATQNVTLLQWDCNTLPFPHTGGHRSRSLSLPSLVHHSIFFSCSVNYTHYSNVSVPPKDLFSLSEKELAFKAAPFPLNIHLCQKLKPNHDKFKCSLCKLTWKSCLTLLHHTQPWTKLNTFKTHSDHSSTMSPVILVQHSYAKQNSLYYKSGFFSCKGQWDAWWFKH